MKADVADDSLQNLHMTPGGHSVVRYQDTYSGFLYPLRLLVVLKEDKGSDDDILTAGCVGGRGRVDAGAVE